MNDTDVQLLAAIVRDSDDAIIGKTLDGIITSWNGGAERIYGYTATEAIGRPVMLIIPPDRADELPTIFRKLTEGTGIDHYDTLRVTKDGRLVNISLTVSPIRDAAGVIIGASSIGRDVTRQKEAENALRASARAYQQLMEQASDAILLSYPNQPLLEVNQRACEMFGYTREELLTLTKNDLILPATAGTLMPPLDEILAGKIVMEHSARCKDGTELVVEVTIRQLDDRRIVTFAHDITKRKAYEELLLRQAFHDPLTGLANRALFNDRIEHAFARVLRRDIPIAVLYLDLDRFKVINDSLTHEVGDQLLVQVGRRLQASLRPEDTAARLGGDEFAVLLENVPTIAYAQRVAKRIMEALQAPFAIGEHEIVITTSIGIASSMWGQSDAGELVRAADLAMYRAKQTGKGHYEVFEAEMASRAAELHELEADLRRALERNQLRIHYQPEVELDTGRLIGLEALLRWEHPRRGLVTPDVFIALAEETRLILPIDRWVLREACRQVKAWQAVSPVGAALEVSVNLSPLHFQQPELVADVVAALEVTGLDPGSLVLEITERAVMNDAAANVATLHALKALGVQLAVDDFGTGYSSLSYLHRFPIDILKIDHSFIDGLGRESEDTVIVRAVIGLAQSLGLVAIAEGVETAEQVTQLQALGCRLCQGYFFSRPLPTTKVDALLE